MSIFDDNDFDDIVSQFFGDGKVKKRAYRRNYSEGEEYERIIDVIEIDDFIYVIFELPGYGESDISVSASGKTLEVRALKKDFEDVKEYLVERFSQGVSFKKNLPENADTKDFNYTIANGILEIKFKRKK